MANWTHFFLIRIEFLGFRYHGWQKQAKLKSVQGMVDKTFEFIFQHENFKTLGCGRTDAKVSADDFAFELFTMDDLHPDDLLSELNSNLPADIRAKSVAEIDSKFNIIQHPRIKEYHYYFSFGAKKHPFNAPFIRNFKENLDISIMQEAANLFLGTHNFKRYASKPSANTNFEREILTSAIVLNEQFHAGFAPQESFIFKVSSKGFLRYQVRLMMGALINVGTGDWTLEDLQNTLTDFEGEQIKNIVPSSGLNLHKVTF